MFFLDPQNIGEIREWINLKIVVILPQKDCEK